MLWIYGINSVESVLGKRPAAVKKVFFISDNKQSRHSGIIKLLKNSKIEFQYTDEETIFKKASIKDRVHHQKVFALIEDKPVLLLDDLFKNEKNSLFLLLDGITDPGNLGAIIRTASALGVHALILPKDRSAGIDAAVYKTSAGTVEELNICMETNLVRTIEKLKKNGFWVYGIEEDADSGFIHKADLKGKICCITGGEDSGIRRLLKESCDQVLKIPMSSNIHSYNASIATALFLYEVQRQNGFTSLLCV